MIASKRLSRASIHNITGLQVGEGLSSLAPYPGASGHPASLARHRPVPASRRLQIGMIAH